MPELLNVNLLPIQVGIVETFKVFIFGN
uniref:Uncharacterized protein n=1 Tax=Rhizophora mucronata TaxID=61149 RepID=A0A2P2PTA9_RHIMU